ncbi:hypothetical protein BU26DRAFT_506955 [Trematosphaeria pertusa]|uniref:Uncharacterized protein n=1 Tax=Trematosphaeria pertusa TaxID=390896 RepID=A0A6A6IBJ5_9PLEO|nr:uncharacterized protein BU26DRAFT_506955 [Trematosphaeria pertusa]KAF2247776.1 hypothetical protein BU26DRAFT_506955 [Trematosphaeria pertusa]
MPVQVPNVEVQQSFDDDRSHKKNVKKLVACPMSTDVKIEQRGAASAQRRVCNLGMLPKRNSRSLACFPANSCVGILEWVCTLWRLLLLFPACGIVSRSCASPRTASIGLHIRGATSGVSGVSYSRASPQTHASYKVFGISTQRIESVQKIQVAFTTIRKYIRRVSRDRPCIPLSGNPHAQGVRTTGLCYPQSYSRAALQGRKNNGTVCPRMNFVARNTEVKGAQRKNP